jgi:hypothetical protein
MKVSLRSAITPAAFDEHVLTPYDTCGAFSDPKYLAVEANSGWGIKRGAFSTPSRDINDTVMHMYIAGQRLGKHIPEAYALNNRRTSIDR